MTEKEIGDMILREHPYMFRNAQGFAVVCSPSNMSSLKGGGFLIKKGAPMHFGLFPGSSDMIGWETKTITRDMVGKKVAIFQSIEIKTKNDRLGPKQAKWNKIVEENGGIVEVWHEKSDGSIDKNSKKY